MHALRRSKPEIKGVILATRGNHGQSIALAARTFGMSATIVVPRGNSEEKNVAMRAYGAELITHGKHFQESLEFARELSRERRLWMQESFHSLLVQGVASYGLELLTSVPDLDTVYVPVGLGSGICGMIACRDALRLRTDIVGVVAEAAPAYAESFANRRLISTESADTFADGIACTMPAPEALEIILAGVARIVCVSESEIADAMRHYYTDTHNLAEGAGAASLAALLKETGKMAGRRVAVVLSGGNVDTTIYRTILAGGLPCATTSDAGSKERHEP